MGATRDCVKIATSRVFRGFDQLFVLQVVGQPENYGLLFPAMNASEVRLPQITKIAAAAILVAVVGLPNSASARRQLYPVTRCGPDLAYLCRLHGSFDSVPFHYNTAVRPDCIKPVEVETPNGLERRIAVVCGAPQRPTVWWW